MVNLYQICWLVCAQINPGATGAGGAAEGAGEAVKKAPGMFDNLLFFLPAMLMVMILYSLFMGRSQNKEKDRTASAERLAGLKKNDRVVTAGGIIGTVVNIREDMDHVSIRVDDSTGARMQVLKQSIARVMNDEDDAKDQS